MYDKTIVVADGGRARFFGVQPPSRLEGGPRLIELEGMEGHRGDEELFPAKAGRNRARGGGPAHSYDDHHRSHLAEVERRFAHAIASRIASLIRDGEMGELILVAAPKMLGFLRWELPRAGLGPVALAEVAEDLTWHDIPHIHAALVRHGLMSPDERPNNGYHPRGQAQRSR